MFDLKREHWMVVFVGQGQFAEDIWNRKGVLRSSAGGYSYIYKDSPGFRVARYSLRKVF